MTDVNMYVVFGPNDVPKSLNHADGVQYVPKAFKASNTRGPGQWPQIMPLPRWEPTWVVGEAIDNVLDFGQDLKAHPEHVNWPDEPVLRNLDHMETHLMTFIVALQNGQQPDMTDLVHLLTRGAMLYATQQRWMRNKVCVPERGHFFGVGKGTCACGLQNRIVRVGRGLVEAWVWSRLTE